MAPAISIDTERFLDEVRAAAETSGAFASVERRGDSLRCKAKDVGADAWYSVLLPAGESASAAESPWWVRLATPDRWLSESIEADLMHYGDPIEELVEEELVELGHDPKLDEPMPQVKHFRSEDKLYTFENPIPMGRARDAAHAARIAARYLLAYEAAFRRLGDMAGEEDGDGDTTGNGRKK